MAYERLGHWPKNIETVRYNGSRLMFRGPARNLSGEYVAFLGGTDTFGKCVDRPYPMLIERDIGVRCVNFGWPNLGMDALLHDPGLIQFAAGAKATVLQVPPAHNMSNRYFQVHPRRNDRFLQASDQLKALYREVDFTEFSFVRHMLSHLQDCSPIRFERVKHELAAAWIPRMRLLLHRIGGPVIMFWYASRNPEEGDDSPSLLCDPAFVSRQMLDAVRPNIVEFVEVVANSNAISSESGGTIRTSAETPASEIALGQTAHQLAARALEPSIVKWVA